MTSASNLSPLEDEEQIAFVQWLELVGLRFTSVPNSTYTTSWKQKSKNYYTGLRAGFPDMVVLVPPTRAKDGLGHLLCPEMKRRQGGTVSAVQKDWIAALNGLGTPNIEARVCKGAQEAMDFVNEHLKPGPTSIF
jgi:hypothetical protein